MYFFSFQLCPSSSLVIYAPQYTLLFLRWNGDIFSKQNDPLSQIFLHFSMLDFAPPSALLLPTKFLFKSLLLQNKWRNGYYKYDLPGLALPACHNYFIILSVLICHNVTGFSMSSDGACGYGEYGRTTNDGQVCAVSTRLFKNGAGCGACYQVYT